MNNTNSISIYLRGNRTNIVRKWSPVLENNFEYGNNSSLMETICLFCEWVSYTEEGRKVAVLIQPHGSTLPEKLQEIKNKLNSYNKRKRIVNRVFNTLTGTVEWELEDGSFAREGQTSNLSIREIIDVFGESFAREMDMQEYRETIIQDILK